MILLSSPKGAPSELSDPDSQSYGTMFQPGETPSSTTELGYGFNPEAPAASRTSDDFNVPGNTGECLPSNNHVHPVFR